MVSNLNPSNNAPVPMNNRPLPWYKSQATKASLLVLGIVGVVLIVLFSQQIGNLLRFFGSKAAMEVGNFVLSESGTKFLDTGPGGYKAEIWDPAHNNWVPNNNIVIVDPNTKRLMINAD